MFAKNEAHQGEHEIQMFIFFNQLEIEKYFCLKRRVNLTFLRSEQKDFLLCFQFESSNKFLIITF